MKAIVVRTLGAPEVLQTELESFEHPWTEEDFLR